MRYLLLETDQCGHLINIKNRGLITLNDDTTGCNLMFFESKDQAIAYHKRFYDGDLNTDLS